MTAGRLRAANLKDNMHEMRKKERRLQDEETRALLRTGEYGVLATIGQDGQPYGVPMSYAFAEDHI